MEPVTSMDSCSSLKSTSSSSSINLSKLEDESTVEDGCRCHYRTLTKKHSQSFNGRFFLVGDQSDEEERHFLEACFLCQKSISCSREIFMYRGDAAFCSEKCRTEQMEMDESLETVERRQRLRSKSLSVSYNRRNSARSSSEEQDQNESIFSIKKRPTIANLTACGLISMQNSGYATNATFMEP